MLPSEGAVSFASGGVVAAALPRYSRRGSAMSPRDATPATLSAWLNSRAAALPVPLRARSLAARLPSKTKGLIAGALGGAALMLIVWGYQSWSADGDVVTTELGATKPARAATAGHAPNAGGPSDIKDLPVLKMDQLRSVPDDEEPAEVDTPPSPDVRAFSAALSGTKAATPPAHAAPVPATAPTPATVAAARHKTTKPASSESDCNPPYYFDSNNIRRLKLDCL